MLSIEERITYSTARAQIYKLFSSLFIRQPSIELAQDFYRAFRTRTIPLSGPSEVTNKGIGLLYQFCKDMEFHDVLTLTTSLRVEWLRLFRGIRPNYGLPPARASAYIPYDIHSLLETYANAGLTIVDTQFEPDYVGVQLTFLYKLVSQELDYLNRKDYPKAQETLSQENIFIHEHLSWISELCYQGAKHTETSFYQGVLFLLIGFLKSEQLWLAECSNTLLSRSLG